jgi:large-conductance mechanosensitive channel
MTKNIEDNNITKFIKKEKKYFIDFLSNFEIIGLTIASILGLSIATFSKTFIEQIIMPLLEPLLEVTNWKNLKINIGSSTLGIGLVFSDLIYILFIAFIMFITYSLFKIYLENIIDKKHENSDKLLYYERKNSEKQDVIIDLLKSIKSELICNNKK